MKAESKLNLIQKVISDYGCCYWAGWVCNMINFIITEDTKFLNIFGNFTTSQNYDPENKYFEPWRVSYESDLYKQVTGQKWKEKE